MPAKPTRTPKKKPLSSQQELDEARAYFIDGARLLSPPVNRAAYSDRMAWIMASMAHLAYNKFEAGGKDLEQFKTRLEGGGYTLLKTFNDEKTGTQAFLASCDDYAVLAFRGTEPSRKEDIKTDAMARRILTLQGKVHTGFEDAYASVEKQIEAEVKLLQGFPLYITGHSLGAALATVCTQRLEHTPAFRQQIAACYTFGSPRVGDEHYDMEFKSAIYRVVNTTDIVTVVPLLAMGYVHIGDIRFLGRKDTDLRRYIPFFYRGLQFLLTIFRLFVPLVGDHAIQEYRRKLEAVAQDHNLDLYVRDYGGKKRRFGR